MIIFLMYNTHCLLWTVHNMSFVQRMALSTTHEFPCTVDNHLQCIIPGRIYTEGTRRERESSAGSLVHFTTVPMSGSSE